MEEELRCCHCGSFYHVPVLLLCRHSVCLSCAGALQKPAPTVLEEGSNSEDVQESSEVDKLSVLSDADSGVSCSSRPTSLVGAPDGGTTDPSTTGGSTIVSGGAPPVYTVSCPKCDVLTPTDEAGAQGLPRYRVLAAVVDKHLEKFQVAEPCQLCDGGNSVNGNATVNGSSTEDAAAAGGASSVTPRPAEVFCDQCLVFYCASCRDSCHPPRGPLAQHWLVSVAEGRALLRARRREREGRCPMHQHEGVTMYCVTCRVAVCVLCLHHGRHHAHDVHALNAVTKSHKVCTNFIN